MDGRDQYDNLMHGTNMSTNGTSTTTTTTDIARAHGTCTTTTGDPYLDQMQVHQQPQMARPTIGHEGTGLLRRSGSSSSSSEDDGMGGRRKKGLKEKMPGGHKTDEHGYGQGHTTAGYDWKTTATGSHPVLQEKKGMIKRIKEKLPGQH